MSIYFGLLVLSICIIIVLTLKIITIKKEIKNIEKSLSDILKSDTNNLITISSNDTDIKRLAISLNKSLKDLRKLVLQNKQINKKSITQNKFSFDRSIKYKELELLNDNRTLLINKEKINLTKTEYAILKQLLLNNTHVLTKERLLDLISVDTEDCYDESSLKVHISNIRKKMKKISEENYIESVWGIGFKMRD